MQLRAADGRVLVGGREPAPADLPSELRQALRDWAEVASRVGTLAAAEDREMVRRRGRLLAVRLARHRGEQVDYVDPITGAVEPLPCPTPRPSRPEPTPWATGLVLAACCAVIVAIVDVTLSRALAEAFGLLWLPANLVVGAGLAPSLWLVRHTPLWRWVAYGVAGGLAVAWVWLLLGLAASAF